MGSLANRLFDDEMETSGDDLFSRLAPSAMGLEALVKPEALDARLIIHVHFNVYYRVFPELEHQRRISGYNAAFLANDQDEEAKRKPGEWAIAYRKLPVKMEPIEVRLPAQVTGRIRLDDPRTQAIVNAALAQAQQQVRADPLHYREPTERRPVPESVLIDKESYAAFVEQAAATDQEVEPQWQVELQVQARPVDNGGLRVSVMLSNVSPDDQPERSPTDHYLFDVNLRVEGHSATILPFTFDILPEDYRYNRDLWGLGRNCTVRKVDGQNAVETQNAPVYRQPVYTTRDAVDPTLPKAAFETLAQDPLPVLRSIATSMDQYRDNWEQLISRRQRDPNWTSEMLDAAQTDLDNFIDEIARFRRGIRVLERYDVLRHAFQLMNRTFANASKYSSWRLFQIVYIVTQLPAIAAREYDDPDGRADWDYVDVLWFPTGGGKTEAYLGLIVFTAFFDRLRGKKAGVTAWMRFPLRLLSLQQLQRLADIMGAAELVRRQTAPINGNDYDPFSVAYLVGSGNTPNRLTQWSGSDKPAEIDLIKSNPTRMEKWLTIPRCPFCGQQTVQMDLNEATIRLVHRCTNPQCPEADQGGILPIFIVDNEIYRYLPTVIAGTIDKVTAIGYERKFSHLFGAVTHRCPKHGYLSLGECTEKYACDVKPKDFIPVSLKDPSPTLQIQDELHLLREELGAFDGHYETFLDTYQQRRQGVRTKIIAATATIEEYENQVVHLYDRKARRFPVPGPELGESFYATTLRDDTRRLFVGIMPHNYTHINAVVRLAELFHREVEDLRREPERAINRLHLTSVTTADEFLEILSNYEVFVTYLLSKREGDRLNQSFEGQLNRELTESNYTEVINKSIIGETPFSEVAAILEELEKPALNFGRRLRSLTATSTISHGVDVERLNYLCFFGMPRQTAEYIQTSSRVGRDHPGVVLVCFNPARERDQSHYHFFLKYHEYLDRLVEPAPVNRWSKFSVQRTIPGLFMAALLNDYNLSVGGRGKESLYFSKKVRQLIESRQIRPDDLIVYLKDAYRTAGRDAGQEFETVIERKVNEYVDMLRNPQKNFTSDNLTDQPMQSLRDVDEQLEIYLGRDSRLLWSRKLGRKRR
ncbi:MAG: hypothetical protein D6694_03720 [Gammaproteobacteria bacterium]|nr:MAG: hypothetical protein D6694_03720 [Gammaproteobacteria bacterium]